MDKHVPLYVVLVCSLAIALGAAAGAQNSVYYFPHVVDGGFIFGSEFWFNNVQATATQVTLKFFNETGAPWVVDLRSFDGGGGDNSTFTFTLQPYSTKFFFTGVIDPLKVGWAKAETSQPVNVSASFSFYDFYPDPPVVKWSAGVLPSPVATQFAFAANVSPVEDITSDTKVDMGFAIVNPGDADAEIEATLIPAAGGAAVSTKSIEVPAGGHYSRFLSELFNDVAWGTRFHGTVRLSSNVNITVLALKHVFNANCDLYSTVAVQPESVFKSNIIYDIENNDRTAPQHITAPVEIYGTSNEPSDTADEDFYAIDLVAGQTVYAILLTEMIGSPLDGLIVIYNPAGTPVSGAHPFLAYTAPTSGTYFISGNSNSVGWGRDMFYRLQVLVD
ncbi:MAG: hypothetical protein GX414_13310 [Acidobacteria bacterium]|nr:hypothetical protein [Acidobacteriota bacterium]